MRKVFISFAALAALASCLTQKPAAPAWEAGDMTRANLGKNISVYAGPDGLPVLAAAGAPKPSGAPGNPVILDWAGCRAAVTYTFDDSQPSQMEHYAELQATGVRLTFYASNGWSTLPGYEQAWSQAVRDGHEIGNHTVHHAYANLSGAAAGGPVLADPLAEIDENTKYITERLGQKGVWTMAAPYGDAGWAPYAAKRFILNRGVWTGVIPPDANADLFNLPAVMAGGGESVGVFNSGADGARAGGHWTVYLFHSILPGQNWYAGVDASVVTGAIEHAKAARDIWIDTMANVGAYFVGQKTLLSAAHEMKDGAATWTWTLPDNFPAGRYVRVIVPGGTLSQKGKPLAWDDRGYYSVALDAGELTLAP